MAPTTEMAEMALVSDISGVCSSGETLRITSRPTKVASMKTYSPSSRLIGHVTSCPQPAFAHASRMHDFAAVRDQRFAHDFVFAVERPAVPSLTRYFRKVAMFLAYIWLAW